MNPAEYETMAHVEDGHWWYQGLRSLFTAILKSPSNRSLAGGSALDAGCGTGGNLRMLRDALSPGYLAGFDIADAAVDFARIKNPGAVIDRGDLAKPELHGRMFDVVLCSDVIYTTGVEPVIDGLKAMIESLKPGGLFLLHLPALNWLHSRHDVAVHTRHRFRRSEVADLLHRLELNIELLTYRMFFLFPAVVVSRLPSLFRSVKESDDVLSDLAVPSRPVNAILRAVVETENALILRGVRFPWGSSIIAAGRK